MDKIDKIDFLLKKTVEYLKINESSMPMSKESNLNNHVFNLRKETIRKIRLSSYLINVDEIH